MRIHDGKPYSAGSGRRRHVISPPVGGAEPTKIYVYDYYRDLQAQAQKQRIAPTSRDK